MEKQFDCYTFICDNCGNDAFEDDDHICWIGQEIAWDMAREAGWIKHQNKHYCENCWQYDESDTIEIKSNT